MDEKYTPFKSKAIESLTSDNIFNYFKKGNKRESIVSPAIERALIYLYMRQKLLDEINEITTGSAKTEVQMAMAKSNLLMVQYYCPLKELWNAVYEGENRDIYPLIEQMVSSGLIIIHKVRNPLIQKYEKEMSSKDEKKQFKKLMDKMNMSTKDLREMFRSMHRMTLHKKKLTESEERMIEEKVRFVLNCGLVTRKNQRFFHLTPDGYFIAQILIRMRKHKKPKRKQKKV